MAHFAGVFAKREDFRPEQFVAELNRNLSRFPGERISEYASPGTYICSFNLSGTPGVESVEVDGRLTIVCGAPLIVTGPRAEARDIVEVDRRLAAGADGLRAARGVFCGVSVGQGGREVTLFTDRLGIRPIFYYEDDRIVAFASARRILANCSFCTTDIDLLGALQTVSFGGGLGSRTLFTKIRAGRPAEILHITRKGVSSSFYWRWDEIEPRREWPLTGASELYDRFREAVAVRRGNDAGEHAFLSGGMDSRAIVATLQSLGSKPRAYSFSPPGWLDDRFSKLYAAAASVPLTRRPHYRVVVPEVQALMASELRAQLGADAILPPVWAGDGGSVGFGHVYLENTALEALREGDVDKAISRFFGYYPVVLPRGIITNAAFGRVRSGFWDEVRAELLSCGPATTDRWFYYFLLRNEQRAHLRAHFEDLDLNRVELLLPFFDWEFLQYICSLPVDACLWHGAYSKFFDLLPPSTRAVPWQTYPGHASCPLPMPSGIRNQWTQRRPWRASLARRPSSLRALRYALSPGFPSSLLDRTGTTLRALAHIAFVSDQFSEMRAVALCASSAGIERRVVMAQDLSTAGDGYRI